jgi:hypothetical protein
MNPPKMLIVRARVALGSSGSPRVSDGSGGGLKQEIVTELRSRSAFFVPPTHGGNEGDGSDEIEPRRATAWTIARFFARRLVSVAAYRTIQTEVIPEAIAFVLCAEEPSIAKLGNHEFRKITKISGKTRGLNEKTVYCAVAEPFLHIIRNLHGRAYDSPLSSRASETLV